MELSMNVRNMIEERLTDCEERYGVKVLFWAFRGSLDIGISRKNSDLDLIFVFKNMMEKKVSAIHDIIGYGFDFWGWDIEDAIRTIEINSQSFYEKGNGYKTLSLSKEHARGGLTYYSGIYCCFNKEKAGSNLKEIDNLVKKFIDVMERKILILHILSGVQNSIVRLNVEGGMSACDYLYTIWRLLLSECVYKEGIIGESQITLLMTKYLDERNKEIVNGLRKVYKNSLSKHSQFFEIRELNELIFSKIDFLNGVLQDMEPQNNIEFQDKINEIKKIIGGHLCFL